MKYKMLKRISAKVALGLSLLLVSFFSVAAQDSVQANKQLVVEFYEQILFKGNYEKNR